MHIIMYAPGSSACGFLETRSPNARADSCGAVSIGVSAPFAQSSPRHVSSRARISESCNAALSATRQGSVRSGHSRVTASISHPAIIAAGAQRHSPKSSSTHGYYGLSRHHPPYGDGERYNSDIEADGLLTWRVMRRSLERYAPRQRSFRACRSGRA